MPGVCLVTPSEEELILTLSGAFLQQVCTRCYAGDKTVKGTKLSPFQSS